VGSQRELGFGRSRYFYLAAEQPGLAHSGSSNSGTILRLPEFWPTSFWPAGLAPQDVLLRPRSPEEVSENSIALPRAKSLALSQFQQRVSQGRLHRKSFPRLLMVTAFA